jgi:Flavodoxin-like fold
MTTLLQINASLNNGNGQSSQLANQFVTAFQQSHPGTKIVKRDVAAADPVPHLDSERFGAFISKQEERTIVQHAVVAYSDNLIDEPFTSRSKALSAGPPGPAQIPPGTAINITLGVQSFRTRVFRGVELQDHPLRIRDARIGRRIQKPDFFL